MKQIIRIIYCNSSKLKRTGDKFGYERVAAEFLMGTNYVNRFLDYIATSDYDSTLGIVYKGDTAIGYDIYLDYNLENKRKNS